MTQMNALALTESAQFAPVAMLMVMVMVMVGLVA